MPYNQCFDYPILIRYLATTGWASGRMAETPNPGLMRFIAPDARPLNEVHAIQLQTLRKIVPAQNSSFPARIFSRFKSEFFGQPLKRKIWFLSRALHWRSRSCAPRSCTTRLLLCFRPFQRNQTIKFSALPCTAQVRSAISAHTPCSFRSSIASTDRCTSTSSVIRKSSKTPFLLAPVRNVQTFSADLSTSAREAL